MKMICVRLSYLETQSNQGHSWWKRANCKVTTNAKQKPAGWKEHSDKVLIPAGHADPNGPGMLEGQRSFWGRRDASMMLPAEKGGRRSTDVDQKRRDDGADGITAEL